MMIKKRGDAERKNENTLRTLPEKRRRTSNIHSQVVFPLLLFFPIVADAVSKFVLLPFSNLRPYAQSLCEMNSQSESLARKGREREREESSEWKASPVPSIGPSGNRSTSPAFHANLTQWLDLRILCSGSGRRGDMICIPSPSPRVSRLGR